MMCHQHWIVQPVLYKISALKSGPIRDHIDKTALCCVCYFAVIMSVSGKYITYGEGENSTTVMTEHKSKLCAPGDIIQASRHHQHRTVLQDLSLNTGLPPVHHEKVMSPILSVSNIFNMVKKIV